MNNGMRKIYSILGIILLVLIIIFATLSIIGFRINPYFFTWSKDECLERTGGRIFKEILCKERPPLFRPLNQWPMKEKIKKIVKYSEKYLPDILFLFGVWISSYNLLRPPAVRGLVMPSLSYAEHFTEYKVLGIILIALAVDIAVRRYFANRNSE